MTEGRGASHGFVSQTSNACRCGLLLADCEVASRDAYMPPASGRTLTRTCPWHSAHGKREVVLIETALLIAEYAPGNKPPPWTWEDEERLIRSLTCCCEGCPCAGSGPAGWYQRQVEQDMEQARRWIGPPAMVGADKIVRDGHHRVIAAWRTGVPHVETVAADWSLWWQT